MGSEKPFLEIIVCGFLKALRFQIGILLLKERNIFLTLVCIKRSTLFTGKSFTMFYMGTLVLLHLAQAI